MKNFPVLVFVAVTALAAGFLIGEKHASSHPVAVAGNSVTTMTNPAFTQNTVPAENQHEPAARNSIAEIEVKIR
ncbi:MAG TPA: hypothetical protein VK742_08970, partial [Candidatus Sulfotelmatobacter sp.]|nr:hypothetical protein [Candidatus Sulfotelmatobacter sp.]